MIKTCGLKRHHPQHEIAPTGVWAGSFTRCDGTPRWPYARPKPPPIRTIRHTTYQGKYPATIAVYRFGSAWYADRYEGPNMTQSGPYVSHAAAIMYAQKLAQERSGQRADS